MSPRSIKSSKTLKTEHEIIFLQLWNTAWSFSRSHVCFIILYHWPKLYVDIIFTSRVLFLSNLWELWQTDYTTFGEDISNELFLSYSKIRRHCCSGSWVTLETTHHNPYYSALSKSKIGLSYWKKIFSLKKLKITASSKNWQNDKRQKLSEI